MNKNAWMIEYLCEFEFNMLDDVGAVAKTNGSDRGVGGDRTTRRTTERQYLFGPN